MSQPNVRINLRATHLFGNQAAEDEPDDVFQAYAVERDEVADFADPNRRLCVARAYKGEGKSALLRLTARRVAADANDKPLIVSGPVTAFSPSAGDSDFETWVRAWKQALMSKVAHEVGNQIGFAWSDDDMALVEEAEKAGFRQRGLIAAILDRLKPKVKVGGTPSVEIQLNKLGIADPEHLIARWSRDRSPLWIIVDDVDQNFENTEPYRVRIAAFFVACRQLVNAVPELRIRAAVRPNVWTIIKFRHESLSHIEQYITNLRWDEASIRRLLAMRVKGYLIRSNQWADIEPSLPTDTQQKERSLIALVFDDPMSWGPRQRPPHVVLRTLSKHRPRWLIELCSLAAKGAVETGHVKVGREEVVSQLLEFGRRRVEDTVAEFRSQCPQVDELISALHGSKEEFSTDELLDVLKRKVTNHLTPRISGVLGGATPRDVAAFLYEIGVLFARKDFPDGDYEHIAFSQRPTLLRSRANVDSGLRWEIHPVFRQVLEVRDPSGHELKRSKTKRRVCRP